MITYALPRPTHPLCLVLATSGINLHVTAPSLSPKWERRAIFAGSRTTGTSPPPGQGTSRGSIFNVGLGPLPVCVTPALVAPTLFDFSKSPQNPSPRRAASPNMPPPPHIKPENVLKVRSRSSAISHQRKKKRLERSRLLTIIFVPKEGSGTYRCRSGACCLDRPPRTCHLQADPQQPDRLARAGDAALR